MSDIIINDIDPVSQYTATAGQKIFSYNYPIRLASDLKVYLTPAGQSPNDSAQILVLNIDYMVTGVGSESGGTIVLVNGATVGSRITIYRNMPMERSENYVSNELDIDSFNKDFNNVIMMMQQMRAIQNKIITKYQKTGLIDQKNLDLPLLENGQIWKKTTLGIEAVTLEENPDVSSLRSELANNQSGTDGSRIVGYYSSDIGSTTVHAELARLKQSSYGVDSGTPNTYQVTLSPAPVAYYSGYTVNVKISNTNTTNSTLQINGLGIKTITALTQGVMGTITGSTLIAGMIAIFVFDSTLDVWQLINPSIAASEGVLGEVRIGFFKQTDVPPGWLWFSGNGTVGDASSGATIRANSDTQSLFEHLWTEFSFPSANAKCPVIGGLGISATDDFNDHKQITLPWMAYRALTVIGTDVIETGLSIAADDLQGASTNTLGINQMPSHNHAQNGGTLYTSGVRTNITGGNGDYYQDLSTGNAGGDQPHSNLSPRIGINAMIKL